MNSYDLAAWIEQYADSASFNGNIFQIISKKLRYQADKIADLQTTVKFLEEECKAMRKQANDI